MCDYQGYNCAVTADVTVTPWGQQTRVNLRPFPFQPRLIRSASNPQNQPLRPLIQIYTPILPNNVCVELFQGPDFHIVYLHHSNTRSAPYDPPFDRPPPAGPSNSTSKTAAIQMQVDDAVGIMKNNIAKVSERAERLDSLQDKTGTWLACMTGFL